MALQASLCIVEQFTWRAAQFKVNRSRCEQADQKDSQRLHPPEPPTPAV